MYYSNILLPKQAIPRLFLAYGRIRQELSTFEKTGAVLEQCNRRASLIW